MTRYVAVKTRLHFIAHVNLLFYGNGRLRATIKKAGVF